MNVPLLDLDDAAALAAAAREIGLFLVRDHGIAPVAIDAQFANARAFFALPAQEKALIDVARGAAFRGYEAVGSQTIDPRAPGDLKEGFIMGPDLRPDHPHVLHGYPNTGANVWPRRPLGFRAMLEAWVDAMNEVARRVARCFARSLGLVDDAFAAALAEPLTYAQLFHYPAVAAAVADASLGAGAHRDYGFLTLLAQDGPGLEARVGDRWVAVPFVPHALIVIFGEAVVRLTDGRYRSPLHRVAANRGPQSRYSLPTFVDFPYNALIGPLTPRAGEAGARFARCLVVDHMRAMRMRTLSDELESAVYQSVPPPTRT
jgi:isopenicillin N synthase-like dioxygenase